MIVRVREGIAWGRARVGAGLSGVSTRPDRLRLLAEGALVVLIVAQLIRLVFALMIQPASASTPERATPPSAEAGVFARIDAFFRSGAPSSLAAITGASTDQIRLFGTRAGQGGGGSAILGLADGRQLSIGVGEEIEPGLVLRSVAPDHVTVARGPSVARIDFGEIPAGVAAPTGPVVDPQRLIGQASLRPRMKGMSISGFIVSATGDGQALRDAGLRSGDVILAVNGIELNGMGALQGLRAELADATAVEIRYERAGRVSTTTIRTGR